MINDGRLVIAGSGHMQSYISAALKYLRDPENGPLTLESQAVADSQTHATALSKLVSVAEIIKREYPKTFASAQDTSVADTSSKLTKADVKGKGRQSEKKATKQQSKGNRLARTLWQYNCLTARADSSAFNTDGVKEAPSLAVTTAYPAAHSAQAMRDLASISSNNEALERETNATPANHLQDETASSTVDTDSAALDEAEAGAIKAHHDAMQMLVVSGRKRPRKRHEPVLKIVLSTRKLMSDDPRTQTEWTCQRRHLETGARKRKRKRKSRASVVAGAKAGETIALPPESSRMDEDVG